MARFLIIFVCLLGLSPVINGANFTTVFEWDELDYKWSSDEERQQALQNGTFKPEKIEPTYLAVFGQRLFLAMKKGPGVPKPLVWLPTSDLFASREMQTTMWTMSTECSTMQTISSLEVSSVGRLWVLDNSCENCSCPPKLWIFDLAYVDRIEYVHIFPENTVSHAFRSRKLRGLALDETPDDDTYAYAADVVAGQIVVFTLRKKESWAVQVHGKRFRTLACSQQLLFLNEENSYDIYSVPLSELRLGKRIVVPKMVGSFSAYPYRMTLDKGAVMHAAFLDRNYISTWKTNQGFKEERFYEEKGSSVKKMFTMALSATGNIWMMVTSSKNPRFKLLRAPVGEEERKIAVTGQIGGLTIGLTCTNLATLLILGAIVAWVLLKRKKTAAVHLKDTLPAKPDEFQLVRANRFTRPRQVDSGLYEEPKQTPPPVNMATRPDTSNQQEVLRRLGPVPPIPEEYDDVGPVQAEPPYFRPGPQDYLTMTPYETKSSFYT